MRKYLRVFSLAFQANLQYRANLIGWFVVGSLPSIIMVVVWFNILGNRGNINGLTKGDFILYYFFMTIGWYIVGGTYCWWLGAWIKNGDVNKSLLKPFNIIIEASIREQAWKVTSLIVSLPATLLILYIFRNTIHFSLNSFQFLVLLISLLLGALIFTLLEAIAGMSTFWFTEVWPFAHILDIFNALFGGRLAPIVLMPLLIQNLAAILPFKYTFYVPASIMINKGGFNPTDLIIQAIFVVFLFIATKLIWAAGVRRYEAIGG